MLLALAILAALLFLAVAAFVMLWLDAAAERDAEREASACVWKELRAARARCEKLADRLEDIREALGETESDPC